MLVKSGAAWSWEWPMHLVLKPVEWLNVAPRPPGPESVVDLLRTDELPQRRLRRPRHR